METGKVIQVLRKKKLRELMVLMIVFHLCSKKWECPQQGTTTSDKFNVPLNKSCTCFRDYWKRLLVNYFRLIFLRLPCLSSLVFLGITGYIINYNVLSGESIMADLTEMRRYDT